MVINAGPDGETNVTPVKSSGYVVVFLNKQLEKSLFKSFIKNYIL